MRDVFQLLSYLSRLTEGRRHAKLVIVLVTVAGLAGGAGNAVLIGMINSVIQTVHRPVISQALLFAALCLLVAGSRFLSQYGLAYMASHAVLSLRLRLCLQIMATPLRTLEELGSGRLIAHLTDDVGALSEAAVQIPVLIVNTALIAASLGYLAWLSLHLMLLLLTVMILGILAYQAPIRKSTECFRQSRENWNEMFKGFQGLTQGIKELKLHRGRRDSFLESYLKSPAGRIQRLALRGFTILAAANSWGQILFFLALGAVIFGVRRFWPLEGGVASGYALVLLFIIGPLESILNTTPVMGRARVSVEQLEKLGNLLPTVEARGETSALAKRKWRELELRGLSHSFHSDMDEQTFSLGPINMRFEPGEIVFVIGGNGSGKTTLGKLLTGLYRPQSGTILLDGVPVVDENLEEYRHLFSAVFSDFYLFDSLLGLQHPDLDEKARVYLEMLRLQNKVRIENGVFSTVDLSQGQRKRLALLTAYLEGRSFYVFDEWSADQDPVFREVFYRHVLPSLRDEGKTIVVITHDDRYFELADRVIELDYGRVRRERSSRPEGLMYEHA